MLPLQQPSGHEVLSQMQVPPLHLCPVLQAGPVPHLQLPSLQVSERIPQEPQIVAGFPQTEAFWAPGRTQVLPLQQPLSHEVASQMQFPPLHLCPTPH